MPRLEMIRKSCGRNARYMARNLGIKTNEYLELEKKLGFTIRQYFMICFLLEIDADTEL